MQISNPRQACMGEYDLSDRLESSRVIIFNKHSNSACSDKCFSFIFNLSHPKLNLNDLRTCLKKGVAAKEKFTGLQPSKNTFLIN